MSRIEINVPLGARSYPIFIGAGLLDDWKLIQRFMPAQQLFIVTNTTVAPLYLDKITRYLSCDTLILPDGEVYKTLDTLKLIFDALLEKGHDRKTLLCALGGGVIGDMTGFAASCYRRGVAFIQIPTTLLAQVDAAIGGKTAVNHPLGKNMLGSIYQPRAVIIDIDTLSTLAEREYRAGLAEVVKYGLMVDAELFAFLETHVKQIMQRDRATLLKIIARSCEIKSKIVAADETEQGQRALLNLGHTFAHAIETATEYKIYLHGEAVAMGLVMAARMSFKHGWLSQQGVIRIKEILQNFRLPLQPHGLAAEMLWKYIQKDKKVLAKKLRLILLRDIGNAVIEGNFSEEDLHWTLENRA